MAKLVNLGAGMDLRGVIWNMQQTMKTCRLILNFWHRVKLKPVERFENGVKSSGMSLLMTEIFIYSGSLCSRFLEASDWF